MFDDYLSSVFTFERLEGLTVLENKLKRCTVSSYLNNVLNTEELVYEKLSPLKSKKARGNDWHGLTHVQGCGQ